MIDKIKEAWAIPDVQKRIQFVLIMFAIFALGARVPVPGVSSESIAKLFHNGQGGLLGLLNAFSGGALRSFSLFAMGVAPYINASIIMQLLGVAVPKFRDMQSEGEAGRKRIANITRRITIPLGLGQSFGLTLLLGLHFSMTLSYFSQVIPIMVILTAGTMFLLWLGEQVTKKGVGNGVSLIIFAGIALNLPSYIVGISEQLRSGASFFNLLILIAAFVGMVVLVVYITQGTRRIPVLHFKRVVGRGQTQASTSFLPIKVNAAGVMPVIFAISLMLLPATLSNMLPGKPGDPGFIGFVKHYAMLLQPGANIGSTVVYGLVVFAFTFFYTAVVLPVDDMAENLNKSGSYIPGVRPGKPTYDYLEAVVSRMTTAGATFLAFIAIVQYEVPELTGFPTFSLIGGTSLLILVGVAIDTMQAIEAQLLQRNYQGFIKNTQSQAPFTIPNNSGLPE